MLTTTITRTIATALSGAAIAGAAGAPAAWAMPADPLGTGERGDAQILSSPPRALPGPPSWPMHPRPITPAAAPTDIETAPDAGFDLSSAAIGAGLLIVVLAAGGLAWRRPIARGHSAAGA